MKMLLGALLALLTATFPAVGAPINLPSGVVKPAYFETRGINVLSYQKGVGGLNVWLVERAGVKTVFYTSQDNRVMISGVVWDAQTGRNLSDAYLTQVTVPASTAMATDGGVRQAAAAPNASAVISGINSLQGVKEGTAHPGRTLYIIFDPRCPHCHAVYRKTRQWVQSGGAIKWIPVSVISSPVNGPALVADIMQSTEQQKMLSRVMQSEGAIGRAVPTATTQRLLSENESYFFAAFERNKGAGEAGVPVAFFVDKKGVPQMVNGIDDDVILKQILNDIQK